MLDDSSTSNESLEAENSQFPEPVPVYTFSPIAGFWRRLLAWLLDVLLLFLIGQVIGIALSSILFQIGPYGRPIGLLFILPYFGILNSRIGNGQTLGKRLLKIAVRDKENRPINPGRAVLRIAFLAIPAMLNGWALPIALNPIWSVCVSIIVFGIGGALFYTMLFNWKVRQGLHDLLFDTYVVHLTGKPIESFPNTSRIHRIIAGAWIGVIVIGTIISAVVVPSLIAKTPLASVYKVYETLQKDPRFFTVSVNDNTSFGGNGQTVRSLNIEVWYRGKWGETERQEVANSIFRTVFQNMENIDEYDAISIKVTSAYDIGIASGNIGIRETKTVEDWRKEIGVSSVSHILARAFAAEKSTGT